MSQRLAMLEKMIAAGSQDPFVHYARAMELRNLQRGAEALAAFTETRTRFPDYVPTYLMAGQLALELGEPDTARWFLQAGVEKARESGDDHAESELVRTLASLN